MPRMEDFEGQTRHLAHLRQEFAAGQYANGYLFAGPKGTGKRSVARLLAAAALCRGEGVKPCGDCGPCRRALSGTHPDIHVVEPERGKRDISVGVMRRALEEAQVRAFEDGGKFFLIPEAERLNPQAQNALLKTLEEPPEGTAFLLSTDKLSALLPTVRSRTRLIRFHPLTAEQAEARLAALGVPRDRARLTARLAEGCVGEALQMDEAWLTRRRELAERMFGVHRPADIPAVTAAYGDAKDERQAVLALMEGVAREAMLAQADAARLPELQSPAQRAYAAAVPVEGGAQLMEAVRRGQQMLGSYVSFAAILETILLKVSEEYHRWPW